MSIIGKMIVLYIVKEIPHKQLSMADLLESRELK
jgi:hypothetical protein